MYSTRTRIHARIPNGYPREEKRASDKSPRTSEEVRVGVGVRVRVGPVEFKLYTTPCQVVSFLHSHCRSGKHCT